MRRCCSSATGASAEDSRRRRVEAPATSAGMARRYGAAGDYGTGANMAFRREVFDRIGPFDPALDVGTPARGGGDLEMFFRVLKHGPRAGLRAARDRAAPASPLPAPSSSDRSRTTA